MLIKSENMRTIRRAAGADEDILTEIATASEAYWGYEQDFMERFREIYRITGEFITENIVFVAEDGERIAGVYAVLADGAEGSLEYLFIKPTSIGKGYGKALWDHMLGECKRLGIRRVEIVSGPHAKGFYAKMGAKPAGEVDSLVTPGRRVPRLIYEL